jgi:hypothetical protein
MIAFTPGRAYAASWLGLTLHAPVVAVLALDVKPLELICAPKGIGPRLAGHFSCKAATS